MSLSKRLRYEILNRDNHTCRYCGGQPPDVVLTVDHVLPTALGGSDDPSNLCAACRDCNAGKSSVKPGTPTVDNVARDAERWAAIVAYLVSGRTAEIERWDNIFAWFDQQWCRWCRWTNTYTKEPLPRDDGWRRTIEIWLNRGVSLQILNHHIDTAMNAKGVRHADIWRYYCGIIWKLIRELDREAAAAMDDWDDADHLDDVMALIF